MNLQYNSGFVTFADILGWKGIWQTNSHTNPVNSLIEVKDTIAESILLMEKKYYEHLFNAELKYAIDNATKKEILNSLFRKNLNVNEAINNSFKAKPDLEKFRQFADPYSIEIKIDLISDTFIITSTTTPQNQLNEFYLHMSICQRLVLESLKQGLLIRGATSYGEFYNKELVFVGPAIDDSATWHEMGEEIGIFLTPKAMFMLQPDDFNSIGLTIGDLSIFDIITLGEPMMKVGSFKTYIVDWYNGKKHFDSIINKYPTILPDIHLKILHSSTRLEYFNKLHNEKLRNEKQRDEKHKPEPKKAADDFSLTW